MNVVTGSAWRSYIPWEEKTTTVTDQEVMLLTSDILPETEQISVYVW